MTIENTECPADSGETFDSIAPYTQEAWAEAPAATASDVDRAVASSHRAFQESWWRHDPRRRAQELYRLADLLQEAAPRLAELEARDNGKTIQETSAVNRVAAPAYYRFAAAAATTANLGEIQQASSPLMESHSVRQPYGVVAVQVPWNNPLGLMAQEAHAALSAGNAIVVKPSELAPCSILEVGKIIRETDIPPGIINIISGFGPVAGAALCEHPLVRKIIFTGGGEAARLVARQAADRLVPLVLELGGKSSNIVFEEANLEQAVAGVVTGFTAGTGQSCVAGSRVLIHAPIYDRFVDQLVEATSNLVLGDPLDPETQIGPLVSQQHFDKVSALVKAGAEEGARVVYGGGRPSSPPEVADHPLFFEPTIFDNVGLSMRIAREEVFGPVTCLLRFEDEKEALAIANDTEFGLAAGVWSKDINRVRRVSRELEAGTVFVNNYRSADPSFPYGGIKESGYGRECGLAGLHEMTYIKSVRILYEGQG